MGRAGLAAQDDAARLAVEPVTEPDRQSALVVRKAGGVVRVDALDERVRQMATAGVDRQPRRLVDRHEVLVLVQHREPLGFSGHDRHPQLGGDAHDDVIAVAQLAPDPALRGEGDGRARPLRGTPSHQDVARADQVLDRGPRAPVQVMLQEGVEPQQELRRPHPEVARRDDELDTVRSAREVAVLGKQRHAPTLRKIPRRGVGPQGGDRGEARAADQPRRTRA